MMMTIRNQRFAATVSWYWPRAASGSWAYLLAQAAASPPRACLLQ